MPALLESAAGFALNLLIAFIIVRVIYFPNHREKTYVFTFFALNTVVYFVMGLLASAELSLGVGFGLFAIFSILRYRTDTIPIHDMTYLFVLIALPVLNSILIAQQAFGPFVVSNLAVMGVLYILEQGWGFRYEAHKKITYERIEMIRPENWSALIEDIQQRTGLPITRIEIGRLNFLRDTADIYLYYDPRQLETSEVRVSSRRNGDFADDD
ncbi:MAG: DUF4956 domain-containing protein [Chloroflexi bacterium]|nr:DUF4956 domain-containing protein [Chloroflexota bacterium]